MELLASLRSPNVVLFMGAAFGENKLGVVMEYCARGSLYDLLTEQRRPGAKPLPWPRRMQLALDIAVGMNYLVRYTRGDGELERGERGCRQRREAARPQPLVRQLGAGLRESADWVRWSGECGGWQTRRDTQGARGTHREIV